MRLIDADVFKENMDFICDAGGWLEPVTKAVREFVKKHIDAQTTVHPEPHWIPCSERLPDESNFYMVTNEYDEVEIIWFAHKDDYDIDKSEWRETDDKIIAWKKVPEPYKEEGDHHDD